MRTLSDIAAAIGAALPAGEGGRGLRGVASLEEAGPDELSFVSSEAYARVFAATRAGAAIVRRKLRLPDRPGTLLLPVDDVELALAAALALFAPPIPRPPAGIDPSARIDPTAQVDPAAAVGACVVIGARTRIGPRTVLHPGVVIGSDVAVAEDCEFHPNVVVRERVAIGARVIIHAGSVVGSDGFGYRWDGRRHVKVPQIGEVVIEEDVEIGSCVCIDRAKFAVTRVGRGAKIDNLVQIAHNCVVGEHCIIVGQTGLAGSVRLGRGVVLGGQTAVRDHVTVHDGAMAAACSAIAEDVPARTVVSGMPAFPHRQSLREQAALRRLPDLIVQVRKLQEQIEQVRRDAGLPPAS